MNIPKIFVAIMLIHLVITPARADDVAALLKQADAFRLRGASEQVEVSIDLLKNGRLDKQRRYSVFLKPGRRSLVLFRHPSERGQKVLMLDDKFWTVMPRSKRPIRITASQKLLGEASSGDIATMTWSEDYRGKRVGDEVINDIPCLRLDLQAVRNGVSYRKVELFLAKDDHRPVRANLYLASGKLAKVADFEMGLLDGERSVVTMILHDRIQKHRVTEIHYLGSTLRDIPDKYFNPAFLARNPDEAP